MRIGSVVYLLRWDLLRKVSLVTFGQSPEGLEGILGKNNTLT